MATAALDTWLAATKLRAPSRRPDVLSRPRLIQGLREAVETTRFTLISAPAGAGKSSLLAELPHAVADTAWAWLLLDEEDNDPSRFIAALAASLEKIDARLSEGVVAAEGRQNIAATIINNVARWEGPRIGVVLDDLHLIADEDVFRTLEYLVDRLPPNMRLVAGARHDPRVPLARWRARGDLGELRLEDLSFTENETAELLNGRLHLDLSSEEIRTLHTRTEGWAAGLRLLASAMAQSPGGSRPLVRQGMRGSRPVFEFLASEVLERQPIDLRDFLLDTSILTSLRPEVCNALTGRTDSQAVLDDLYRRNLYVVASDEAGSSYRYHDLFADFLRDRLKRERPEDYKRLHQRAAAAEAAPNVKLRHLLWAADWPAAAALIENIGPEFAARGFFHTLRRWILDLPEEMRESSPRLLYLLGHAIWSESEFARAQPYLERALEGFRRADDRAGQGEALVALSNAAVMLVQLDRAKSLIEEALTLEIPPTSRVQLHAGAGWVAINQQDWQAHETHLSAVLDLLANSATYSNPLAMQFLLFSTGMFGVTGRLEVACRKLESRLTGPPGVDHAICWMMQAACAMIRGTIDDAERLAKAAEAYGRNSDNLIIVTAMAVSHALIACGRGDWDGVERATGHALATWGDTQILRNWGILFAYFRGRARWSAGDLEGLAAVWREFAKPGPEEAPAGNVYRNLLAGLYYLSERSWTQAERAFQEAVQGENTFRITAATTHAGTFLAYSFLKRGRLEEALEVFAPYLRDCERFNAPGLLMRQNPVVIPLLRLAHDRGVARAFCLRTLELLGVRLDAVEESGGEALSDREREVLRVMAEGLGNREIAARLFVSEATVKTHVQRILRKLDANSRTQAVARARDLMLL